MTNVGLALVALALALIFSFFIVFSHKNNRGHWRTFVVFEVICISLAAGLIYGSNSPLSGSMDLFAGLFFILTTCVWAIGTLILGVSSLRRMRGTEK